jgi:ribosomal protein S27AE
MSVIKDDIDIMDLPRTKIEEAFGKCTGYVMECPKCGEPTAFLGSAGINDKSECHKCGYTMDV